MRHVLFLFGILNITFRQNNGCHGPVVPELQRRARNYIALNSTEESYISDEYLALGWYSVDDRRMPDSSDMPNNNSCGTNIPIYIKGKHPTKEQLLGGVMLNCTVCEKFPYNDCENERTIYVILCPKDLFYYYLPSTSKNSAYCFDPPNLQNVTEFDAAPTDIKFGTLTVKPKLRFELKSSYKVPYNIYECYESGNQVRQGSLLYSTYWFCKIGSSRKFIVAFERESTITPLKDADLIDAKLTFGINIGCSIRVSKSIHGLLSNSASSEDYYIGIKFSNLTINLPANGSAIITMTPTIPLGCYAHENDKRNSNTGECSIKIVTAFPQKQCEVSRANTGLTLAQLSDVQARCGAKVTGFYPFDIIDGSDLTMNSTSINVTSIYLSKTDVTNHELSLVTTSTGSHNFWKNQKLGKVLVNTNTDKGFIAHQENICYARVDPHMRTSDGKIYDYQKANMTILYRHDDYPIEVQQNTTSCNNGAYCTCAVAIRAGGDVWLCNLCGVLKFIGMTSCKDFGSLTIQKYQEYEYQIQTNIGTLIIVTLHSGSYQNLMSVTIYMAPKDFRRTKGLCGIFDGDKGNDYHDRKGKTISDLETFFENWRIKDGDLNLLEPSCNVPVTKWEDSAQSLFCMCNCTLETVATDQTVICHNDDNTAVCSTSQFIACEVETGVSSKLCMEFNKRCYPGSKRSVYYHDPETEQARRAKLAHRKSRIIFKRDSRETVNITEDMAENMCRQKITDSKASTKNDLLMGLNITQVIQECKYDVFTGQDPGWIGPAVDTLNNAVKAGHKRDANYTFTHTDEYNEFIKSTCPMNCSGKGKCNTKGQCECDIGWIGPDCLHDAGIGPIIEDIEGDGRCDQIYGSECKCFSVQSNILANNFSCKGLMKKRFLSGTTLNITEVIVDGYNENIFNGICCFEERNKRSLEDEHNTTMELEIKEIEFALSNDAVNFGPSATIYIYDSTCVKFSKIRGTVSFALKMNTCQINGLCYAENDFDVNDACKKCKPIESQFAWSNGCPEEKSKEQSDNKVVIIVLCVGSFVVLVSLGFCVYRWKKRASRGVNFADINDMPAPRLINLENRPRHCNPRDLFLIDTQQ